MKRIKRVNPTNPIKLACVNTKDAGKIMGVTAYKVRAYAKQGKLQRIPVGTDRMVPLYEIANLLDITFKEVMNLTCKHGAVICYVWIEASAYSMEAA